MHPLIAELNEQKKQFQEKARVVFNDEFKSFFERFPEIREIVWTQYTPYFNDGEPCTFCVHAPVAKPTSIDLFEHDIAENYSDDDDEYSCIIQNIVYGTSDERARTERENELVETFNDLASLVQGMDDLMQDIFGDHVIVRASKRGFDVEVYDHD